MKFTLVDLKIPGKKANREHTGGFGSFMQTTGAWGGAVSKLKSSLIELPVMAFGFAVDLLNGAGHDAIISTGDVEASDVFIIHSSMHCYPEELAFAKELKQRFPQAKIGFYGPFANTKPEFFQAEADFIIGGELENAILAFLDAQHDFAGQIDFGVVQDLSMLNKPNWHGYNTKNFNYFPMLHKRPFFPIIASRGCAFNCDFCPYMVTQTKKFRMRPVEKVIAEIKANVNDYGMQSLLFRDICFTHNKKYSREIAEAIIAENLNIEWGCETRIDCLTEELIDTMVASGFRGVNLGLETGNNDILKDSGKKNPEVEYQERMIDYMLSKGIRINAFYMLGLIGDTVDSMQSTINYSQQLNTLGAQFCINTPFPGTKMHERLEHQLITQDYANFNEYNPVVKLDSASPEQIKAMHSKAYKYYLQPKWLLKYGLATGYRLLVNLI